MKNFKVYADNAGFIRMYEIEDGIVTKCFSGFECNRGSLRDAVAQIMEDDTCTESWESVDDINTIVEYYDDDEENSDYAADGNGYDGFSWYGTNNAVMYALGEAD